MPTFQDIVFQLKRYWSERGCIIQEPYDIEVGAGTSCPETFLRALGPRAHKVMPETMMWGLFDEREAGRLVDAAGGEPDIVGPQDQPAVAGGPGEPDAFIDELSADAEASRTGLHEKASQLCGIRVFLGAYDEHTAGTFFIHLGDPEPFRGGIVIRGELGKEHSDECLELLIPAEFGGVQLCVPLVAQPTSPIR